MTDGIDLTDDGPADGNADDALMAELRAAAAVHDPVPPTITQAAKASFTWRTIDQELAELADLAFDSSVDESPVLVRGPAQLSDEQLLTFETERISVDLQVTADRGQRRLVGQLAPACVADIEVRSATGVVARITTDDLGRVPATVLPAGAFSLHIVIAGEDTAIVTDWVTI
jgi:hypothetical protein